MLNHFGGGVTGLGHWRGKPAMDFHGDAGHQSPRFSFPARCARRVLFYLGQGQSGHAGATLK